jgi:hypothetical protein
MSIDPLPLAAKTDHAENSQENTGSPEHAGQVYPTNTASDGKLGSTAGSFSGRDSASFPNNHMVLLMLRKVSP